MSEKLPQLGCVELTVLVSLQRKHGYHYFKYNMYHVRQTTTTRMC